MTSAAGWDLAPGRVPRESPRKSPPLQTCPVPPTISPQEQAGFQAPCSSALESQPLHFWDGLRGGGAGSRHVFPGLLLRLLYGFSSPSISKDDLFGGRSA